MTEVAGSWLIGQSPLAALRAEAPQYANRFFARPQSFILGWPPSGWPTQPLSVFRSYAAYAAARVSAYQWVMYDPERWNDSGDTPLVEQQHPAAFISAFCSLAHARNQRVICAPSRDLMGVPGADYGTATNGEDVDTAFLASRLPAACGVADVYHCQAQALQPDTAAYMRLVDGARAQLPEGFPVWAGLTTLRGHEVADIVDAYRAAAGKVAGFWLNTNPATIGDAVMFLKAIS